MRCGEENVRSQRKTSAGWEGSPMVPAAVSPFSLMLERDDAGCAGQRLDRCRGNVRGENAESFAIVRSEEDGFAIWGPEGLASIEIEGGAEECGCSAGGADDGQVDLLNEAARGEVGDPLSIARPAGAGGEVGGFDELALGAAGGVHDPEGGERTVIETRRGIGGEGDA